MNGPDSWKTKCGIRRSDDVAPLTDRGTLIMRNGPASARHAREHLSETAHYRSPSLVPFAIDIEDHEPPARNSDALGLLRITSQFDYSRSTTNVSFWSGLSAGLGTLAIGVAIAFTAFTSDPAAAIGTHARSRHLVTHVGSSLGVETAELAETKLVVKKKVHRARRPVVTAGEGDEGPVAEAPAAPDPSETE